MKWSEISPDDQAALIEWYNVREEDLGTEDWARLAKLFTEGRFAHWHCPACGEQVLVGRPDDWGHFQGVRQSESVGELCTECSERYLFLKTLAEE